MGGDLKLKEFFSSISPATAPAETIQSIIHSLIPTRKLSGGSPGDLQLASMLGEVDYFVTADKIFVQLIQETSDFLGNAVHCCSPVLIRPDQINEESLGAILRTMNESRAQRSMGPEFAYRYWDPSRAIPVRNAAHRIAVHL